jgi:hypothetical protein
MKSHGVGVDIPAKDVFLMTPGSITFEEFGG